MTDTFTGSNWQEWVTVITYLTILFFVMWRVLATQRK